jgi:MoaA/NifB/PqqE/SkfB family radical SAM enzyme
MTTYINPRQKALWHTRQLEELRRHGATSAPVNVEIDLSNRCSLGCEWCHFAYTHTKGPLADKRDKPAGAVAGGDLMPTTLAKRILVQLHVAGVRSVTWTGGGEPTLHPDFDEIISYCPLDLDQGLYTHGGHINPRRGALLKQYMTWVYVSLDECTRDTYLASKGVDRFDQAVAGITNLVAAAGEATIGVGYLLHERNWRDVHEMVRLARDLGANYVQFRPTVRFEHATAAQLIEDAAWVDRAIGRLNAYVGDDFVIADLDRFRAYQHWQGHPYSTCHWSAMQTVVTPNGKMWRCTNKREHPDALVGDLSVETFAEVWQRGGRPCGVDASCRILCRGHIPNVTLDAVLSTPAHPNFI